MPITTTEVAKYSVVMISPGEPNKFFATIALFDAAGAEIGFLRFYEPSVRMARNEFRADLGHPLVSYRASSFAGVVDLLRNESPVYFKWFDYSRTRRFATVETNREPVGESES
jgi:hypothetical protein